MSGLPLLSFLLTTISLLYGNDKLKYVKYGLVIDIALPKNIIRISRKRPTVSITSSSCSTSFCK